MAIRFEKEKQLFTIHTEKSTYQIKVDQYGRLLHTYFGPRTDDSDFSYLIIPADHGFCGQPGGAGDERCYSLDYYPQEYPVYGNGDYRVKCLKANRENHVPSLDLHFVSFQVYPGKYRLDGLPGLYAGDGEAETLEILLKDAYEEIYVRLLYGVLESPGVITRAAIVENRTDSVLELKRVMSMALDFGTPDLELIHFYGRHMGEKQLERGMLPHGITEIASERGMSSHQHNPFVILCEKDATEDWGGCYGVSLLYSGSFRMQAERDQFDYVRLVCGLHDDEFLWRLAPGETFTAPEVVLAYSDEGLTGLSGIFHRAYGDHLIRGYWKDRRRPALVNSWEAAYFHFNGETILELAREAAGLGLEMVVMDDGWFGKRDDDNSGLGDWQVNEKKLGCTLKELVDQVNGLGLRFGIWVEPEMVSEDSDLYRSHPDWALVVPGRDPNRGRNQLVLDLSREEVRSYIKACFDTLMASANIEYVKWDLNRSMDNVYSTAHPRDSQGTVRHKNVLGLYEILEYIHEKYPRLLLEGCSGGGGRYDAGMLYYAPQVWGSDNTDAIERLRIQYGTSFGYPMSTLAAHVSACPNHQTGGSTPFKTRGICALQGSFGYELDLSRMTEEEKKEAARQIAFYKEHYRLIQRGTYYRLASPYGDSEYTAWSYVDEERREALLAVVYTRLPVNRPPRILRLKGLNPDASYDVNGSVFTGRALMQGGLVLPVPSCDFDGELWLIRQI